MSRAHSGVCFIRIIRVLLLFYSCAYCLHRMKINIVLARQRYSLELAKYVYACSNMCVYIYHAHISMLAHLPAYIVCYVLSTSCDVLSLVLSYSCMHLLGGIHGEIACRQAQSLRGHDPEDHQGLDAVAQIPTPPQGHHSATSSCQRHTG